MGFGSVWSLEGEFQGTRLSMRPLSLSDGTVIASLDDLSRALWSMETPLFLSHAGGERNDFADWVERELGLGGLAARMRQRGGPLTMAVEVLKHQNFPR